MIIRACELQPGDILYNKNTVVSVDPYEVNGEHNVLVGVKPLFGPARSERYWTDETIRIQDRITDERLADAKAALRSMIE